MVIEGLFAGWELPLLHTPAGHAYLFSKDIFELLVLVGLGFAFWRRGIQKKERVVQSFGAWLAIGLIAILMITDLATEGARIAAGDLDGSYLPISGLVGGWLSGLGGAALQAIYSVNWWIHLITLFVFANELPYSKHFHVYTSIFNVFFANLDAPGKLPGMDLEDIDEDTTFGISTVTDFTWKQMLDMYTCTECGRCRAFCRRPSPTSRCSRALSEDLSAINSTKSSPRSSPTLGRTATRRSTSWCRWWSIPR